MEFRFSRRTMMQGVGAAALSQSVEKANAEAAPRKSSPWGKASRQLYPVSRHTLRDIAEQFQRWLKGWSEKRNIPVVEAPSRARNLRAAVGQFGHR